MGRAIFISYRRDDSEGEAGRLFDDLVRAYGEASVFMDVAGINPGIDFRKAIDDNVATCGVLLAIIGHEWASIANSAGKRRLDDENDFVRLEIASALARDIPVIPVLVHDAKMPKPDELPENLKNLVYRNSVELTHARWNSDVQLLTRALAQYVASSSSTGTEPIHATIPVQLPPANAPETRPVPAKTSKTPMIVGAALVVVLAIAAVVFFAMRGSGTSGGSAPTATGPTQAPPAAPPTSPPPRGAEALAGVWTNPTPAGRGGLMRLEIAVQGDRILVHALAQCQPTDCDWGTQTASFDGQRATATWSLGPEDTSKKKLARGQEETRVATVTMTPNNGTLHVVIANTYSRGNPNQKEFEFVRGQ